MKLHAGAALLLAAAALGCAATRGDRPVVVGSKAFTESVILGEMATALARGAGVDVEHRRQLGGTEVLFRALVTGAIDVYPEYTGTITHEILRGVGVAPDRDAIAAALAGRGVRVSAPLGFSDGYALAMTERRAAALGIRRISDLAAHPELAFALSNEMISRGDGWPALRARYALPQDPRGMDHDLAYHALADGVADVTDVYTTDAEIPAYHLRVLEDDRRLFPTYEAVWLYRADLPARAPAAVAALAALAGKIDAPTMAALNARAKLDHVPETAVADAFLAGHVEGPHAAAREPSTAAAIARRTGEHATLVVLSLLAAMLVAIPLGILAARWPRLGNLVVGATEILQTIPSLALLVLLIPLFGIGTPPALVALFLYGLLPILRNTHAGLVGIPPSLRESALALGLPSRARLRLVELPLALPSIVAGIKTSAVIAVGNATIGALVGAGGYGQPILTGVRLDDFALILQGAIPAALMAIAVERLFDALARRLTHA
jgi:osmoprotectant transport system permease protein